jgi:hypothetical protein
MVASIIPLLYIRTTALPYGQEKTHQVVERELPPRALLRGLRGAPGEARQERLEPRAQRRERLGTEGQARRVEQAALARQAAVDPRSTHATQPVAWSSMAAADSPSIGEASGAKRRLRATRALARPRWRVGASVCRNSERAWAAASSPWAGRCTSRGLSAPQRRAPASGV